MKINRKLSIIIVNYNSWEFVSNCIHSVLKFIKDLDFEIIVVDNNSPNRDIQELKQTFSEVKFVQLDENKGFGFANNKAAEIAEGEYLLFLNPDTFLIDSSITQWYKFHILHKVGISSPILLNSDFTLQYSNDKFHSISFLIAEAFNLQSFGINQSINRMKKKLNEEYYEIDWAIGAAILISNQLFKKVGMFDEHFFLYYEDSDLAKKVVREGYKNYCYTKCRIVHILSVTSNNKSFLKYHVHKSRLLYISKYINIIGNICLRGIFVFSIILRILQIPLKRKNVESLFKNLIRNLKLYLKPVS